MTRSLHVVPDPVSAPRHGRHRAAAGTSVAVPGPGAVLALRSIPVIGWIFLIVGVVRPFRARWLRVAFWIDVALSVGVHAAQIPAARKVAAERGISGRRAAMMTMLLGATWWKTLGEGEQ
ncbi:hypothetical protein [Nocardia sp. NPDC057272]|uniref:hypothetical protein n=1 Tax=Nocardia sp. NPDC057272 TaxID=3346079 RepID=UPI003644FF64